MRKLSLTFILLLASFPVYGQVELAGFELIDNNSVGLTVAPFEKWGTAVGDIDRNGWPDIFTIRWARPGFSRIYLNDGGVFQDITQERTPIPTIEVNESHTRTVAIIDYDNDGDRDLFFGTDTTLFLLRNNDGIFEEIARSVGLVTRKPGGLISRWDVNIGCWADYDLDGDLDVVISQTNNPDFYFYGNDDGLFTNIADQVGLTGIVPLGSNPPGSGGDNGNITARMQWVDFDMDGDPDLASGNMLLRNDDGVFTDIAQSVGFTPSNTIDNTDWFDFDNDGDLDFFKSANSPGSAGPNELWLNDNGTYVNVSADVIGLELRDRYKGVTVGDFDNDGDQDIFVQLNIDDKRDLLFVNDEIEPGVRVLTDVAEFVGITKLGDRKGGAWFDYDMDGFLDLYIPSAQHNHILYHNLTNNGNWAGFILEGTVSNRDALGSLVKLYSGSQMQIRHTRAPTSWLTQDNPYVHFGIGLATSIDSVVIRWPLGTVQVLKDVAINQYHHVVEGMATSVADREDGIPSDFDLLQNYPNPFNAGSIIQYSLPRESHVSLTIYNIQGQKVTTLVHGERVAGIHRLEWTGNDATGQQVATGVYLYRLVADQFVSIKKMVFMK
ncbi:FG-GAP-like repeat-containing protein [bacterium]|nr:FG-GAP-like repeat-containing protein [bacterium]